MKANVAEVAAQAPPRGMARKLIHMLPGRARTAIDTFRRSHYEKIRNQARWCEYVRLREIFINNGNVSKVGVDQRAEIVRRFEAIDANVTIASQPVEGLALAEMALSLDCAGEMVECGCYAGGSTAKLSIVAAATGCQLRVYDSFEGLPEVDSENLRDLDARHTSEWSTDWTAGKYACRLEQVRESVRRFGEVELCTFVPGWFAETLTDETLPERVAMVFADVDIASSVRDCFVALWPRLSERGVFASHDVAFIKVMKVLYDPHMWTEVLKDFPPIFFGAGFGMGEVAPHLGFAVKGNAATATYIKSLTLEK